MRIGQLLLVTITIIDVFLPFITAPFSLTIIIIRDLDRHLYKIREPPFHHLANMKNVDYYTENSLLSLYNITYLIYLERNNGQKQCFIINMHPK